MRTLDGNSKPLTLSFLQKTLRELSAAFPKGRTVSLAASQKTILRLVMLALEESIQATNAAADSALLLFGVPLILNPDCPDNILFLGSHYTPKLNLALSEFSLPQTPASLVDHLRRIAAIRTPKNYAARVENARKARAAKQLKRQSPTRL